jgi:uncharacterized protein
MDGDLKLQVHDQVGPYKIVSSDRLTESLSTVPAGAAKPLAAGGTSVVYVGRTYIAGMAAIDRAIKFFSPIEKIRLRNLEAGASSGEANFLDEIALISRLNHQNLVKIIDGGQHLSRHYYVMDFIKGPTLQSALQQDTPHHAEMQLKIHANPTLIIRIAQQICAALSYMHEDNNCFHFDVAPKNIFIQTISDQPHIVLGDLGTARFINTEMAAKEIFIAGTKKYCPPSLREKLNSYIPANELIKQAARWDVYSTAIVIQEMLNGWGVANHPNMEALEILIARVENGHGSTINSIRQLGIELERLLPANVITAEVIELSSNAAGRNRSRSIPIHHVPVTNRITEIIEHPEFARLHNVPQMFLARSLFPGGVHSMYEHALGSYGLMRQMLLHLLSVPRFRAEFSSIELEEALVACLLQRVSSFTFDRIISETRGISRAELLRMRLDTAWPSHSDTLRSTINGSFANIDIDRVIDLVVRPRHEITTPQGRLVSSMLKSSIDCRVMDYLARDSHHTGVPVAAGIDVPNLIASTSWCSEDDSLSVTRDGVFALEGLLCARYWMFSRIYWNVPIRSTSTMLRHIIYHITEADGMGTKHLARKLCDHDERGALGQLETEWKTSVNSKLQASPIVKYLAGGRPTRYEMVVELFKKNWPDKMDLAISKFKTAKDLESLSVRFNEISSFRRNLSVSDVLFDLPTEGAEKFGEDIQVDLGGSGGYVKASEASQIIEILPKTFNETARRLRVFVTPTFAAVDRGKLADELRKFLDDEVVR